MVITRDDKQQRLLTTVLQLCAVGLFLSAQPAKAVTEQSLYGGSGIGVMRTADLMQPGEFSYSVRGSMYEYLFPPATTTELDTTAYMGISFAWGHYVEMGFSLPYQITYPGGAAGAPAVAGGNKPFTGYAKLSFTGYVKKGFGAAVTFYGSYAPTPPLVWIASGQNMMGVELNFSHWSKRTGFHFNVGVENGDVRRASDATGSYTYSSLLKAQIGMDMYMTDNMQFSFSMLGSVDSTANENVMIATGFHYIASPKTIITIGTNSGFPSNRSNPQRGYFLTLTYSPNGQQKREPDFQKDLTKVQQQNQRIENKLTDLDKKLDEINKRLQEQPPAATGEMAPQAAPDATGEVSPLDQQTGKGNGIRVIILNASGKDGMGGKVADMLRAKGYEVVAVDRMEQTTPQTWIHYNSGMANAAVKLDGLFPGEQHVVRRKIENADIIIIIGSDQLQQ